ncbi:MAG: hypothetical protein ABI832_04025 [bacterium]
MGKSGLSGAVLLVALGLGGAASAQSVFERKIIENNPCSHLRSGSGLISIEIDKVESVRIDTLSLVLKGDMIEAGLSGALSCKTSDAAVLPGSVAADIAISAQMSVTDCKAVNVTAALSNISGEYGPVLDAFRSEAEDALLGGVREQLVKACQGLVQGLMQ